MEREIKLSIFVLIILGAVLLLGTFLQLQSPLTGYVTFDQTSSEAFSAEGAVFENTTHNGTYLVLEENKTSGSYISKVFDSGNENSTWNNLTYQGNNVNIQVRTCESSECSNATFSEANLENLNLTSQYLQYRVLFELTPNVTSYLESASVSYSLPEVEEELSIEIFSPVEGTEYNSDEILLNASSNKEGTTWEYSLNSENKTSFTPGETLTGLSEGNHTITIYAQTSPEENTNQTISFSISIPSCADDLTLCNDETNCTNQGGYWYDGQCNTEEETTEEETITEEETEEVTEENVTEETTPETGETAGTEMPTLITAIELEGTSNLEISPRENEQVVLQAENTGDKKLTSCEFSAEGDASEWISYSSEPFDLNAGDSREIFLTAEIPEGASEGEYSLSSSVRCSQISKIHNLNVKIIPITFEFNITDTRRLRSDVRVIYDIKEVSGEDQVINIKFTLFNNESLKISEAEETINLSANEEDNFRTKIPFNESTEGEITLHTDVNSKEYSHSVERSIERTSAPILGFVAIGDFITGTGGVMVLVAAMLFLVAIIFSARRIRKREIHKKKEKSEENKNI